MATVQDLTDQLTEIGVDIDELLTEIQRLKDQIAAGTPVTQEQLDALVTQAQAINVKS